MEPSAPYHAPEPQYHAPVPNHVAYTEPVAVYPDAVDDDYTGAQHSAEERSDEYNNINGSYQVSHADGRSQRVEYTSGDSKGYRANVEYTEKSSYYKRTYGH